MPRAAPLCILVTFALSSPALAITVDVPIAPLPSGTVIDSSSIPFNITGTAVFSLPDGRVPYAFVGTFDQQVLRLADNTLTFVYQFNITQRTPQTLGVEAGSVNEVSIIGFPDIYSPQLFATSGSGGLYPHHAQNISSAFGMMRTDIQQIPWESSDTTTRAFFITTNAKAYDANARVQLHLVAGFNDTEFGMFPAFGPVTSIGDPAPFIPEPASLALFPLALAALSIKFRRTL